MTDNTNLIARLEAPGWVKQDTSGKLWIDDAPMDAAVELRRLSARVAKLEGALGIAAHQLSLQSQVWADDARATLKGATP